MSRLRLEGMDERHRALTPPIASSLQEAAAVCLSRHHTSPVTITMSDNGNVSPAEINWVTPDARTLDAWANTRNTTELGACGCVIAGIEESRALYAVRRAETGTGADYALAPSEQASMILRTAFV